MSYVKLSQQRRLWHNGQEQKKIFLAGMNIWTRPPGIREFYGTSAGTIPVDINFSKIEFASGDFQRLRNRGGAAPLFDVYNNSITTDKLVVDEMGGINITPKNVFAFTGPYPDLMNTRIFILVNLKSLGKDQYFMGKANPQSNIYLNAAGNAIIINRRNPDTNLVETSTLNLLSPITTGLKLYEIDFASSGKIQLYINGVFQSEASHTFPTYAVQYISGGQHPAYGWGLDAVLYQICSVIKGGNFTATVDALRDIFFTKFNIGTEI